MAQWRFRSGSPVGPGEPAAGRRSPAFRPTAVRRNALDALRGSDQPPPRCHPRPSAHADFAPVPRAQAAPCAPAPTTRARRSPSVPLSAGRPPRPAPPPSRPTPALNHPACSCFGQRNNTVQQSSQRREGSGRVGCTACLTIGAASSTPAMPIPASPSRGPASARPHCRLPAQPARCTACQRGHVVHCCSRTLSVTSHRQRHTAQANRHTAHGTAPTCTDSNSEQQQRWHCTQPWRWGRAGHHARPA